MPKVKVNGTEIMYEAFGKGPTVFWLQSPFAGRNPGAYYVAGRLSSKYHVIIWDSPNTGQSDNIIKDSPSEWHTCCEYLNGLCEILGESSVHFVGCSGGGEMALLLAHLYPKIVKSVSMYRPTDTMTEPEQCVAHARYYAFADVAEKGTMKDVLDYSLNPPKMRWSGISMWINEIAKNPLIKDVLLTYDPKLFASIMKKWGDWMSNGEFYKANLDDSTIASIKIPVLIAPSADPFHPEELAKDLYGKFDNAKYVPSPFFRNEHEMYGAPGEEHHFGGLPDFMPHLEHFLESVTNIK